MILQPYVIMTITPESVRETVGSFRYLSLRPYSVKSAKRTMEIGTAHCLEGALVAALLMERLGHEPRLLNIGTDVEDPGTDRMKGLAVYVFKDENGWGAIGKTRYPPLDNRDAFQCVCSLAESFVKPLEEIGYGTTMWGVNMLSDNYRWRDGNEDLGEMTRDFKIAIPFLG